MRALWAALVVSCVATSCSSTTGADAGAPDAGLDAGTADAGVVDAGTTEDAGSGDAGTTDGGATEFDISADHLAVLTSSTSAKLNAAWERGELDEDTLALYSLVGRLVPRALPAQYRGDVADTTALSHAHVQRALARRSSYPPEQRALLDAITARPGTTGFLRINNLAEGPATSCWERFMPTQGNPGAGAALDQAIDTVRYRFIPMYPMDAATDAEKAVLARLRVALEAPVANTGDLASATHLSTYFDSAFDYLLSRGLTDPRGLPDVVANAGKVPVYVMVCDDSAETAFAATDTGAIFVSVRMALEDPALRKVVLPHESVHVFQHDAAPPNRHDAWPLEALAVALEHFMSTEVRRWSGIPAPDTTLPNWFMGMNRVFRCPEEPMHSLNVGTCKLDKAAPRMGTPFPGRPYPFYSGDYSRFVWFLWLAKTQGKPAIINWWKDYVAAGSIPTARIPWAQLADFQMALLGDPPGIENNFEPDDRARFNRFGAGLDYRTHERGRYSFRYEESQLKNTGYRAVPLQAGTTSEPKSQDADFIELVPGGTFRILVDNPATNLTSSVLSSVVYQPSSGPFPEVRSRFFARDSGGGPTRRAASVDTSGFATEPGLLYLIPTGERFLVATFTADPLAVGRVKLPLGVSLGPKCFDACMAQNKPKVPPCCPDYCSNYSGQDYTDCVNSCNDAQAIDAASGEFCTVYCWGSNQVLAQEFAGTEQDTIGPRMCTNAQLPQTSFSGLVPVTPWLDPVCREFGLPIGGG